jgi:hypothetical protein
MEGPPLLPIPLRLTPLLREPRSEKTKEAVQAAQANHKKAVAA